MKKTKKPLGLYIHIPFCLKKCAYCDFYSCTGCDPDLVHHYISSCMLQMEDLSESCRGYEVDTVYVGGGTPTTLPIKEFERLLSAVERNFKLSKYAEITTEANPATADKKYLKALRKLGVNRLSIGFQSANISELKLLGRIHTVEDFANMYKDARAAGFDNISVDLMYGIPAQSMQSFQSTLEYVCDMNPEHLSLYCLKIEEGTPFHEMRDSLELPGEDAEYDMYMWAVDYLRGRGYDRYEISNFAKEGYYSRHNYKYWNADEYIGIGTAAHSYFGGERYSIIKNIYDFIDGIEIPETNMKLIEGSKTLSFRERMSEYVMLRMRLDEGVNAADFETLFGTDFHGFCGKHLDEYVKDGFVIREGRNYRFSSKGMFVSNYILSTVLDFEPDTSFA